MPGDLRTVPGINSLTPLSLAEKRDARENGHWVETWTRAGGNATLA